MITTKAEVNMQVLESIRSQYKQGLIGRDTAKLFAKPIIERMNEDIERIAKKHKKKPFKLTFERLMR